MRNKKILIVGAGFGQVPAILKSKEMGLFVLAVDKNPNAEGVKYVDEFHEIDIIDTHAILELAKNKNINGLLTMQSDIAVPSIGVVNDRLNLTGVSYNCAINCSLKHKTRLLFERKNIPQPKFIIVNTLRDAIKSCSLIPFPVVIKAVDSSGSRGVTKVNGTEEIEGAYLEAKKYNRQSEILVEEFIAGVELGAQTFSVNGKCVKVILHNDTISSNGSLVPIGHSFPSSSNNKNVIKKYIKDCIEALDITNGPANVDLIISDKDQLPKIIEVGARIGATCLPELVSYNIQKDWVEMTILNAIGSKVNFEKTMNHACAAEILESYSDGKLKKIIIPEEVKQNENLLELEVTAHIGDDVSILRKGTDRIGKIMVKGKDYNEAERIAKQLKSKIKFLVE